MTAHLLTGAGSGIGAALARRLTDRGDRLTLLARNEARAADVRVALSNSIGLGGHNSTIILRRFDA